MTYNQDIALELNTNTSYIVVGAKQGDYNSRTITATILQNGELCHFGDNTSASYRIRRPDGYANWAEATILPSRSRIQITLSAADLEVAGRCYADILIKDGSESLGTTNFIIDVQAAPNIAESAVQSQAFSYLQNMVYDADRIIESAQAWTEGKRGTVEVIGDGVKIYTNSSVFDKDENGNYNFDFEIFKNQIEPLPIGETKVYTFVYTIDDENNGYWQLGNQRIDDISQYGIILSGTPNYNDIIQITASFADPAWHNNAKWYMEALQNASVGTVTTAEPGTSGDVTADYDGEENAFMFNFDLPSIKPHASISVNTIDAFNEETKKKNDASAQVLIRNCDAQGNIIEDENSLHKLLDFSFIIPRGEPAGISDHVTAFATSEGLVPGDNAVVQVTAAGPDTAKEFTFNFQIPPGAPGDPPTFSINSVTSVDQDPLHPDVEVASVEAVQSVDKKTVALSFTLPKGLKGDPGKDGTDGKDGINGTGQVNSVMDIQPDDGTTGTAGDILAEKIFDLIYPLGSIYITKDSTFIPSNSPNDAQKPGFGGTWTRIIDLYLYGANPGGSYANDTYGSNTTTIDFAEGNGIANLGFNNNAINSSGGGIAVKARELEDNHKFTLNYLLQSSQGSGNWGALRPADRDNEGNEITGDLEYGVTLSGTQTIDIKPKALPVYIWQRKALSDGTTLNSNS